MSESIIAWHVSLTNNVTDNIGISNKQEHQATATIAANDFMISQVKMIATSIKKLFTIRKQQQEDVIWGGGGGTQGMPISAYPQEN